MMRLADAAEAVGGRLVGGDVVFDGVVTDSRAVAGRELFVALSGPHFDGHEFVARAAADGAAAAMVSRCLDVTLPRVEVADCIEGLARLAVHWRGRFDLPVVAVTGSNGKTTVKGMIGAIASVGARGVVAHASLNNHIGVPLTLLRLRDRDRFAVVELGMNHRGEIARLSRLARPTVAVITNAGPAHLEGLVTVENVARAKAEIYEGLSADGVAVVNADDRFAPQWIEAAGERRVLRFALESEADFAARDVELGADGSRFVVHAPAGSFPVRLSVPGRHNVANALAALAAAHALGADRERMRRGLESFSPAAGRLRPLPGQGGAALIDDSYNANPASVKAAIDVLAGFEGERWLVLGDMAELGTDALDLHREVGVYAREVGLERLLASGALATAAADGFGPRGECFGDVDSLGDALRGRLGPGITVLVKGSRASRMERVVERIRAGAGGG